MTTKTVTTVITTVRMTIDRQSVGPVLPALLILFLVACHPGGDAGHGHDRGPGQGHDDDHAESVASESITHFSELTELFVEFAPLVAGETSRFAAHLTRLDDFQPVRSGRVEVVLQAGDRPVARFRVDQPADEGLFTLAVIPRDAGEFRLLIRLSSDDLEDEHDLGLFRIFDNRQAARIATAVPEGDITYLKEQQWTEAFATEPVAERLLRPSVLGFATVTAPADASAEIRAPADGYIVHDALARAGLRVETGDTLGFLMPRLGADADFGDLRLELQQARSALTLARRDVERLEPLQASGAIPERRLLEAREQLQVAQAAFNAADLRIQQHEQGGGQAGIALRSPVAGAVVEVSTRPGAFVRSGDRLIRIAAPERRWLEVRLPERFASGIEASSGAWLKSGDGHIVVLDETSGSQIIQTESAVDPVTRTVGMTLEYPTAHGPELIGARLPAHVFVAAAELRLAVPRTAVIFDNGRDVVYVQTGGETFARRPVVLGIIDGAQVEVLAGVEAGERVVTLGAYLIRLAAAGGTEIGHGHTH